ncbi:kinesin-like protein KIF23 [Frankliniella occidentalis]|uniref:Kinesin-like protein KIF23 n=1 Tax=Frankliniella occidentalis TaxID=133901 RepID=A0A6J1S5H5_FRAOC|nr:kinesin-like protein KIF23 [Frankliniella occidentalis]
MKPVRTRNLPKKTPSKTKSSSKDPVQVFCRLRPMQNESDQACMTIICPRSIQVTPPDTSANYRAGSAKDVIYSFQRVFDEAVGQKEIFETVGLPLVKSLLEGRNGLLFAYGVTGSGKTYTMNGGPQDGGIMPRSLDVLFNSIHNYQAKKYTFKADKMNGFEIQSDVDALKERQQELIRNLESRPTRTPRKNSDPEIFCRQPDTTQLDLPCEDNTYAVFVTYVEIYNNSVFDLLEESQDSVSQYRQVKILREDALKNMYVHGVTEVEVKSPEEAFEAFYKGQKKKRVANTMLNAESSRSHSVFSIRLVQAPLDYHGETVAQEKGGMVISQLSLVDLAGCERTNRTKNSGQRLREAGNINNSLMSLRSCLEILRENQLTGANKMVPYRDSKLTHLFKNYLDGEGEVSMIVCANPRAEDYDETTQVMKFAEMSQEVQIARPVPVRLDFGFTPGRRKANQVFRTAVKQLEEEGFNENIPIDVDIVYSLSSEFPSMDILGPEGGKVLTELKAFLQERIKQRSLLGKDLLLKQEHFRALLAKVEQENILVKQESITQQAQLDQERNRMRNLTVKLGSVERQNSTLQRRFEEQEHKISILQQEKADLEMALSQSAIDKQKVKSRYNAKVAMETEKISHVLEKKLEKDRQQLQNAIRAKDEKLRRVRHALKEDIPPSSASSTSSLANVTSKSDGGTTQSSSALPKTPSADSRRMGLALRNPRHRRSRSVEGTGKWLDHCPATPVPLSTVFQPNMKKRKSVTKLTDVKDITKGTERYCLTTQEQDTDGELETRLYKGDVVPTCSGGAQVIFSDVELLKQSSPTGNAAGPTTRKRSARMSGVDVAERCLTAVEGHGKRPHISGKH